MTHTYTHSIYHVGEDRHVIVIHTYTHSIYHIDIYIYIRLTCNCDTHLHAFYISCCGRRTCYVTHTYMHSIYHVAEDGHVIVTHTYIQYIMFRRLACYCVGLPQHDIKYARKGACHNTMSVLVYVTVTHDMKNLLL